MNSECMIWQGPVSARGRYPSMPRKRGEPVVSAHRFVYESVYGPVPEGMEVCHSCDNSLCVNPAHLWIGSHKENMKDSVQKGRSTVGRPGWSNQANQCLNCGHSKTRRPREDCNEPRHLEAYNRCIENHRIWRGMK